MLCVPGSKHALYTPSDILKYQDRKIALGAYLLQCLRNRILKKDYTS
jgi:hypothetical protein